MNKIQGKFRKRKSNKNSVEYLVKEEKQIPQDKMKFLANFIKEGRENVYL